jgi:hypothetical protein
VQRLCGGIESVPDDVPQVLVHTGQMTPVGPVGQQQQCRHQRDLGGGQLADALVGHGVPVHDPVHARVDGRTDLGRTTRMDGDTPAELMGQVGANFHFIVGEGLIFAVRAVGQLDEINATFHLHADLGHHFGRGIGEDADASVGNADRGGIPVGEAVTCREEPPGRAHAGAIDESRVEPFAQRHPDVIASAWLRDRGDSAA